MVGQPQIPQSERTFLALCEGATGRVMHDFFEDQARETARYAARPDLTDSERTAFCSQMAVWLKLSDMTKG